MMGLQDSIFDIETALEGKPELKSFEDLMTRFNEMERRYDRLLAWANAIEQGYDALHRIQRGAHQT